MTRQRSRASRAPSRRTRRLSLAWLPLFVGGVTMTSPALADSGLFYRPPPGGDIMASWLRHRAQFQGSGIVLLDDHAYQRDFLTDWTSPYSNLRASERLAVGPAWQATRHEMTRAGYTMTDGDAIHAVAWDLGLTKSLPHLQAPRQPPGFNGHAHAGFNLLKAGVAVDTYDQARRIVGRKHAAMAANYAVAAEILAEKLRRFPDHRTSASMGLHDGVLTRFMLADSASDVTAFDATYLMNVLAGELSSWRGGQLSIYGYRQLPPAFRIARVAAAYRDDEGYVDEPCSAEGSASPLAATDAADDTRHLCFVDATDRTVHAWYRRAFQRQTSFEAVASPDWPVAANHLTVPLLHMRPLWVGAFRPSIQSESGSVEISEHLMSMRALDDDENSLGALEAVQSSTIDYLCRVAAP